MTPEGKVKAAVRRLIKLSGVTTVVSPRGGPYAASGVSDMLVCYRGAWVAIEVKRHYPKPTDLQAEFLKGVARDGGIGVVVSGLWKRDAEPNYVLTGLAWARFTAEGIGDSHQAMLADLGNIDPILR